MRKFNKLLSVISSGNSDEAKAKQVEQLLNQAIKDVVEDYFSALNRKKLISDLSQATTTKNVLLGQVTMSDYPDM